MEEYDPLQCIDKALDGFGSRAKNAFFWRMTIVHNSSRSDVISDPRLLVQVIREIFGTNSSSIEKSIIQEIEKKFVISERSVLDLVNAIGEAKSQVIMAYGPG